MLVAQTVAWHIRKLADEKKPSQRSSCHIYCPLLFARPQMISTSTHPCKYPRGPFPMAVESGPKCRLHMLNKRVVPGSYHLIPSCLSLAMPIVFPEHAEVRTLKSTKLRSVVGADPRLAKYNVVGDGTLALASRPSSLRQFQTNAQMQHLAAPSS